MAGQAKAVCAELAAVVKSEVPTWDRTDALRAQGSTEDKINGIVQQQEVRRLRSSCAHAAVTTGGARKL